MGKHRFKEGDEVSHRENISMKMTVDRILKESIPVYSGKLDDNGDMIMKSGIRMCGIRCRWWVDNKIVIQDFHSREIIPWLVAVEGKDKVVDWIKKNM